MRAQKIGGCDFTDDKERKITICAFIFDGEYAALALFSENGEDIEITPHEH